MFRAFNLECQNVPSESVLDVVINCPWLFRAHQDGPESERELSALCKKVAENCAREETCPPSYHSYCYYVVLQPYQKEVYAMFAPGEAPTCDDQPYVYGEEYREGFLNGLDCDLHGETAAVPVNMYHEAFQEGFLAAVEFCSMLGYPTVAGTEEEF